MGKIKFIGLGRGVKRVKSTIDWDAEGERIYQATKEKFKEYTRVRRLAWEKAQFIVWD